MELSDNDLCAIQYAAQALKAIAERQRMVGDALEPLNDIRAASSLAKEALRRFELVADRLINKP